MPYWYISFAMDREHGGFRGATVVEARDPKSALASATLRGLNPGGEAAILKVPLQYEGDPDMLAMRDRLVGPKEMIARGGRRLADLPPYMKDRFEGEADFVCPTCNQVHKRGRHFH